MEPSLEFLPWVLEVQQGLERPPTLELGEQRKLEPWLELLTLELEVCQELELLLEPRLTEPRVWTRLEAQRQLEPWPELLPSELEVQLELELPPILERVVGRKLEL